MSSIEELIMVRAALGGCREASHQNYLNCAFLLPHQAKELQQHAMEEATASKAELKDLRDRLQESMDKADEVSPFRAR
jgi:hypothetical protein